jgi:LmbE family N-acetylglucosaminyl deacetylase
MPDGFVMYSQENVLALVSAMRAHKPAIVLAPPPAERHPDHEAVHKLTRSAAFLAGLPKVVTERNGEPQEPHRPRRILCYMQTYDLPRHPDVYVDISTTWPDKLAALRAFASQFHVPGAYSSNEPHTSLSRPDFLDEMEARARYHGSRIRVAYAEAFLAVEPLGLSSLAHLL